jgi:hypothetical protein
VVDTNLNSASEHVVRDHFVRTDPGGLTDLVVPRLPTGNSGKIDR